MKWNTFWQRFSADELAKEYLTDCHYVDYMKVKLILDWVAVHEGTSVLEAGCGTARVSMRLAEHGARVVGLDMSEEVIGIAQRIARHVGAMERASFIVGDIESLPFDDNRFDIVWNAGVLEHFPASKRSRILREMIRVAWPRGAVIVFVPNLLCLRWSLRYKFSMLTKKLNLSDGWPWGKEEMFTPWGLRALFERVGLKQIRLGGVCFSVLPFFHPDRSLISSRAFHPACNTDSSTSFTAFFRKLESNYPFLAKWFGKDIAAIGVKPEVASEGR